MINNEVFSWRDAPKASFAVIGNPVAHSLSPMMHNAAFKALGLPLQYVALLVQEGEISACFESLIAKGYFGANVTVPHKLEALIWAGHGATESARRIGAVNTVRFSDRTVINTDAPAIVQTLQSHGIKANSKVLILGAGGSARAAWVGLSDAGYLVFAANRTHAHLHQAVQQMECEIEIIKDLYSVKFDAILNATSASLSNSSLGLEWERLKATKLAFDFAYSKADTVFVNEAKQVGIEAIDGRELLVRQGTLAFEYWLQKDAPYELMFDAIRV